MTEQEIRTRLKTAFTNMANTISSNNTAMDKDVYIANCVNVIVDDIVNLIKKG